MSDQFEVTADFPDGYIHGGQHAGSPTMVITVRHIPTGIKASCGLERSQHKNRMIAMEMVQYALLTYTNWEGF
jgi:protein subunit release factor A